VCIATRYLDQIRRLLSQELVATHRSSGEKEIMSIETQRVENSEIRHPMPFEYSDSLKPLFGSPTNHSHSNFNVTVWQFGSSQWNEDDQATATL
jgi:hypothetical protein